MIGRVMHGGTVAIMTLTMLAAAEAPSPSSMFLAPEKYGGVVGAPINVFIVRSRSAAPVEGAAEVEGEMPPAPVIERATWPVDRIEWFFVRSAGTQMNLDIVAPVDAEGLIVPVIGEREGVTQMGLDVRTTIEEYESEAFSRFLQERVHESSWRDQPVAAGRSVRVRRSESAKALMLMGGGGRGGVQHSAIAVSRAGQASEFRPAIDPTTAVMGGELVFRLYMAGSPNGPIRVRLTHPATGAVEEAVTDGGGLCRFNVRQPGVWYVEANAARALKPDRAEEGGAAADWELVTATLSFEVPAPVAPPVEQEGGR